MRIPTFIIPELMTFQDTFLTLITSVLSFSRVVLESELCFLNVLIVSNFHNAVLSHLQRDLWLFHVLRESSSLEGSEAYI